MAYILNYEIENSNTIFESPAGEPETQFPSIQPTQNYSFNVSFSVFDDEANTDIEITNMSMTVANTTSANVDIVAVSNNTFQVTVDAIGFIEPEIDLYRFISFSTNFDSFAIDLKTANNATEEDSVIEWAISSEIVEYEVSIEIPNSNNIVQTYEQEYLFTNLTLDTSTLLDLVSRSKY